MPYVLWGVSEVLLVLAISSPMSILFNRERHYQQDEFYGALGTVSVILVAIILVGVLTFVYAT